MNGRLVIVSYSVLSIAGHARESPSVGSPALQGNRLRVDTPVAEPSTVRALRVSGGKPAATAERIQSLYPLRDSEPHHSVPRPDVRSGPCSKSNRHWECSLVRRFDRQGHNDRVPNPEAAPDDLSVTDDLGRPSLAADQSDDLVADPDLDVCAVDLGDLAVPVERLSESVLVPVDRKV